jgi:hypothetical protein
MSDGKKPQSSSVAIINIRIPASWREIFQKYNIDMSATARRAFREMYDELIISHFSEMDEDAQKKISAEADEKIAEAERWKALKEKVRHG